MQKDTHAIFTSDYYVPEAFGYYFIPKLGDVMMTF